MAQPLKSFSDLAKIIRPVENKHTFDIVGPGNLETKKEKPVTALGQPYPILWSRIRPFEGQPRRYFNKQSLEALADNIQQEGQQVPVKVCTHPTEKGVFILIDGERRYRAFELIFKKVGAEPFVNAFIEVIRDPKEHFRKSWIANLLREDISPLDEAAGLTRLKDDGATIEELATMTGKSVGYVNSYLKLHTLSDKTKELMNPDRGKDNKLSVTAAVDIARSTRDPELQYEIAMESLTRQLNLTDTRFLISQKAGITAVAKKEYERKPSRNHHMFLTFTSNCQSKAKQLSAIDWQDIYINQVYSEEVKQDCMRRIAKNIESLFEIIIRLKTLPPSLAIETDIAEIRTTIAHLKELEHKVKGAT